MKLKEMPLRLIQREEMIKGTYYLETYEHLVTKAEIRVTKKIAVRKEVVAGTEKTQDVCLEVAEEQKESECIEVQNEDYPELEIPEFMTRESREIRKIVNQVMELMKKKSRKAQNETNLQKENMYHYINMGMFQSQYSI